MKLDLLGTIVIAVVGAIAYNLMFTNITKRSLGAFGGVFVGILLTPRFLDKKYEVVAFVLAAVLVGIFDRLNKYMLETPGDHFPESALEGMIVGSVFAQTGHGEAFRGLFV